MMRGYRRLREADQLDRLGALKDAISRQALSVSNASSVVFGAATPVAELVIRQYVLVRVVSWTKLNESVLYALGRGNAPVVHPLPREWRGVLASQGLRVAPLRSALLWYCYVGRLFANGLYTFLKSLLSDAGTLRDKRDPIGIHAHFEGLSEANLPQPAPDRRSHDIVTWYHGWRNRIEPLEAITHGVGSTNPTKVADVSVTAVSSPVPRLRTSGSLVRFTGWGLLSFLLAAADLLRLRWWHALLLHEGVLAARVRLGSPSDLAREFLFHNSSWIYRPLWTYEAEKAGSRITFYFYSTNNETFKRPGGYPLQTHMWHVMSWPRYLVWDEFQAAFVRRAVGSLPYVEIVGPIWFTSSARELPEIPGRTIAVFDVTPMRKSYYQTLGVDVEYYVPQVSAAFLTDIQQAAEAAGLSVHWKRKRNIGPLADRQYRLCAERLERCSNMISIDPDISAVRVIERATVVISMPFTSTALLAREMGKPSCYYDPAGVIERTDRAAHGIPVVSGIQELAVWLEEMQATQSADTRLRSAR